MSALFDEIQRCIELTGTVTADVAHLAVKSLSDRAAEVTADDWKQGPKLHDGSLSSPKNKAAELLGDVVCMLHVARSVEKGSDAHGIAITAQKVYQTRLSAIAPELLATVGQLSPAVVPGGVVEAGQLAERTDPLGSGEVVDEQAVIVGGSGEIDPHSAPEQSTPATNDQPQG